MSSQADPPIRGVIPPIITPFTAEGRINAQALGELIEWYVDAGCDGLWVCGGTGEGISLAQAERLEMIELSAERVAGRLPLVFHVAAPTTDDAVAAAARCQAVGVEAICSVPPFFYGKSDDETVEYFRRLGDASDRPIYLYNLPDASGRPLTLAVVERILRAVPGVRGIKQSEPRLDLIVELLRVQPDLNVLVGRGELMLAALVLGASGCVCASLCMAPERFVEIYRAFLSGDLRRAMRSQRHATRVKELFLEYSVIGATKRVNSLQLGLDCGAPRGPVADIPADRVERFVEQARVLGLLEGSGQVDRTSPVRPR